MNISCKALSYANNFLLSRFNCSFAYSCFLFYEECGSHLHIFRVKCIALGSSKSFLCLATADSMVYKAWKLNTHTHTQTHKCEYTLHVQDVRIILINLVNVLNNNVFCLFFFWWKIAFYYRVYAKHRKNWNGLILGLDWMHLFQRNLFSFGLVV